MTINWWHITTGDPGKTDFQAIADAYTAAHPNVKINITVLENEAFKTKLAATSPDAYPDLFQSWGGGIMAAQADAGLLKDITADIASWKDTINPGAMSIYSYNGEQYGMPWDMGMIGFWYNKDALPDGRHHRRRRRHGMTSSPTSASSRPRASPRSRSPARTSGRRCTCGRTSSCARLAAQALSEMIQSGTGTRTPARRPVEAVLALNTLDPYQPGYKSATYNDEAASVGNGKAAMELMGQWAPVGPEGPERDKKGLGDRPRLVPVPDRRPVAPAQRPTASAAATASRSARTRRPRRSTS